MRCPTATLRAPAFREVYEPKGEEEAFAALAAGGVLAGVEIRRAGGRLAR